MAWINSNFDNLILIQYVIHWMLDWIISFCKSGTWFWFAEELSILIYIYICHIDCYWIFVSIRFRNNFLICWGLVSELDHQRSVFRPLKTNFGDKLTFQSGLDVLDNRQPVFKIGINVTQLSDPVYIQYPALLVKLVLGNFHMNLLHGRWGIMFV